VGIALKQDFFALEASRVFVVMKNFGLSSWWWSKGGLDSGAEPD
jgi:hypothetical protein